MLWKNKRPRSPKESRGDAGEQMRWSGGPDLASRAVTVLVWVALAMGAIGGVSALGGWTAPVPVVESADPELDADRQIAQGHALQVVRAWASATRGQPGPVVDLVPGVSASDLPEQVDPVEGVVVVESSREEDGGAWSVTVAVVTRPAATEEVPDPAPHSTYLRIPVVVSDGGARAVGMPAVVAAPAMPEAPALAYSSEVTSVDAVATLEGFMAALLVGSGDVARYTTPGTEVAPVAPAPYAEVTVTAVLAVQSDIDPEAVTGGEQLEVLATVTASSDSRSDRLQYPLLLTARDGRWEVTTIRSSPLLEMSETATHK